MLTNVNTKVSRRITLAYTATREVRWSYPQESSSLSNIRSKWAAGGPCISWGGPGICWGGLSICWGVPTNCHCSKTSVRFDNYSHSTLEKHSSYKAPSNWSFIFIIFRNPMNFRNRLQWQECSTFNGEFYIFIIWISGCDVMGNTSGESCPVTTGYITNLPETCNFEHSYGVMLWELVLKINLWFHLYCVTTSCANCLLFQNPSQS